MPLTTYEGVYFSSCQLSVMMLLMNQIFHYKGKYKMSFYMKKTLDTILERWIMYYYEHAIADANDLILPFKKNSYGNS